MSVERAPAVAGTFYPGNGGELRSAVEGFLTKARIRAKRDGATGHPKALIVLHAGYVYIGAVAASAYARLAACPDAIERAESMVASFSQPPRINPITANLRIAPLFPVTL